MIQQLPRIESVCAQEGIYRMLLPHHKHQYVHLRMPRKVMMHRELTVTFFSVRTSTIVIIIILLLNIPGPSPLFFSSATVLCNFPKFFSMPYNNVYCLLSFTHNYFFLKLSELINTITISSPKCIALDNKHFKI